MLDPNWLRTQTVEVANRLARRGYELDANRLYQLDQRRKALQVELEDLRNQRNTVSKEIGLARREQRDTTAEQARASEIGQRVSEAETALAEVLADWDTWVRSLPNVPADDVPDGRDESDNVCQRTWGSQTVFPFHGTDGRIYWVGMTTRVPAPGNQGSTPGFAARISL